MLHCLLILVAALIYIMAAFLSKILMGVQRTPALVRLNTWAQKYKYGRLSACLSVRTHRQVHWGEEPVLLKNALRSWGGILYNAIVQ